MLRVKKMETVAMKNVLNLNKQTHTSDQTRQVLLKLLLKTDNIKMYALVTALGNVPIHCTTIAQDIFCL